MSLNEHARPLPARRALLTSALAGLAVGGTSLAVQSATVAGPDPVFALLEAERRAHEAWDAAVGVYGEAQQALWASEWDRAPRVVVGYSVAFTRGPNHEQIPENERVEKPYYVHDHEAIDRDCNGEARWKARDPSIDLVEVEARRARLHRELDEDAAAIAAAPEVVREAETEAVMDDLGAIHSAALEAVFSATPTTPAGLLAMLDVFEAREMEHVSDPVDGFLLGVFAAVRAIVGGGVS